MAFRSKVSDVLGLQGIIVASKGFQSGAKKYAEDNGILAIELNELPTSIMLMAERLESVALPNETTVGEPFWSLYELQNGRETGTIYGTEQNGELYVALFFSRLQASKVLASFSPDYAKQYAVRGLPQHCLRAFILTADVFRAGFLIVYDWNPESRLVGAVEISRRDLIEQYYIGSAPIPDKPMVAPDLKRWRRNALTVTPGVVKERNMRTFINILRSQSESSVDYKSFIKF